MKYTVWKYLKGAAEHTPMVMISILLTMMHLSVACCTLHIIIDLDMHHALVSF